MIPVRFGEQVLCRRLFGTVIILCDIKTEAAATRYIMLLLLLQFRRVKIKRHFLDPRARDPCSG